LRTRRCCIFTIILPCTIDVVELKLSSMEHFVASAMTASSQPPLAAIKLAEIAARVRDATAAMQVRR
jgi:hypothetical protein